MSILITIFAELLKAIVPDVLALISEKANEPTTIEDAKPDDARRDRLLSAIRLRGRAGGGGADQAAETAG